MKISGTAILVCAFATAQVAFAQQSDTPRAPAPSAEPITVSDADVETFAAIYVDLLETAAKFDAEIKAANLKRLRRIEGQVRGLQRMVEEDRYCPEIITQIASVQEALRGVGRQLLRNHLKHCATNAIKKGPKEADRTYDELLELITSIGR